MHCTSLVNHDDRCLSLCDLELRQKGYVQRVNASSALKKRLLEMGFVKGEEIVLDKIAPLGDPLDFIIKGYHISLRRDEAALVLIDTPDS